MGNVWAEFLNLIFHINAIINFKFDVQQSCRTQLGLSFRRRAILNSMSEFQE